MACPRSSKVLRASSRSWCALSLRCPTRPTKPSCWWCPFPDGFCGEAAMASVSVPASARSDPADDEARRQGNGERGDGPLLDEAAHPLVQRVELAPCLLELRGHPGLDVAGGVGQRVGGGHRFLS